MIAGRCLREWRSAFPAHLYFLILILPSQIIGLTDKGFFTIIHSQGLFPLIFEIYLKYVKAFIFQGAKI